MKKITVKMIMDKKPCDAWTREKVTSYIGKGKTLKEILNIKEVASSDRIWCVTRFLPDHANSVFAIWNARQWAADGAADGAADWAMRNKQLKKLLSIL